MYILISLLSSLIAGLFASLVMTEGNANNPMEVFIVIWIISFISLIIYFLPSLIAKGRQNKQFEFIFVINLFSGWTGFGWIVALALAFWNFERVEP